MKALLSTLILLSFIITTFGECVGMNEYKLQDDGKAKSELQVVAEEKTKELNKALGKIDKKKGKSSKAEKAGTSTSKVQKAKTLQKTSKTGKSAKQKETKKMSPLKKGKVEKTKKFRIRKPGRKLREQVKRVLLEAKKAIKKANEPILAYDEEDEQKELKEVKQVKPVKKQTTIQPAQQPQQSTPIEVQETQTQPTPQDNYQEQQYN
ncbi:hypothetical protein EIN_018550 [Entamoeba invadens IP1]|uniref:hypothetical protein n=1 Tax=Entamoeba invadens IP1 TaxID=370355 RepID=UPI0002C3FA9F|nr:hypothetical protein EIN_018550 [Entamoeba invadens IP1]ELP90496.1 hypothetical protein EIN_018550 [Entamoeba invadens IP1]|eukprot:XP_004257267.1 hypothetical protein EIN_018550 [Entamoeba invadens IP1]